MFIFVKKKGKKEELYVRNFNNKAKRGLLKKCVYLDLVDKNAYLSSPVARANIIFDKNKQYLSFFYNFNLL